MVDVAAHRGGATARVSGALDALQTLLTLLHKLVCLGCRPDALEVRMQQGLLGCEAVLWVHHEEPRHQLEAFRRQFTPILLLNRLWLSYVRKFEADEARVFCKLLLLERCEGTEDLLDLEQLVDLALTREQWLTICQLAHDAADGPDVDLLGVAVRQEKLRSSVPTSRHVVRQGLVLAS